MANIREFTPEELNKQEDEWYEWARSRPLVIRKLAARFRPWKLYRMKSSGHRVMLYSLSENNTATVVVLGKYNLVTMERRVFGVDPDDLVECDLPSPDEKVGILLNDDQQLQLINIKRAEHGIAPLTAEEYNAMYERDGMCVMGHEHSQENFDAPTEARGVSIAQGDAGGAASDRTAGSDDSPMVSPTPDPT